MPARSGTVVRRTLGPPAPPDEGPGEAWEAAKTPGDAAPRPVPVSLVVLALAAGVAILLGVGLVSGFFAPPGAPVRGASSPAVAPVPATPVGTAHVVARTAASSLTFDGTSGWITDADTAVVHRFDPGGAITGTIHGVGQRPTAIATTRGRVWVADAVDSVVYAFDAADGKPTGAPVSVASQPVSMTAGPGGVWVGSVLGGTVSVLDTRSGAVRASVALPDGVTQLTAGDGGVWVAGQQDTLTRVRPNPVGITLQWRSVRVGRDPEAVAAGDHAVWVACSGSASLTRVDPDTMRVTGSWQLPDGRGGTIVPSAVAVFDDEVWVADGTHDAVTAVDPATGRELGRPVTLPGPIDALVAGDGRLWAATSFPGAVLRIDPA